MKQYGYKTRYLVIALLVALFVIGVIQNPSGYWAMLLTIPQVFAKALTWVVLTFLFLLIVVDLSAKRLVGRSLRSLIAESSHDYQRQLILVLMIVISIVLLTATL
ncbi:MAG: hypothetical protein MUP45_01275 [Candidatus Marinimicrobia bacterium]|nr:hypothetical protein [Candidatus Neomarinimicrobiota bacterium]